MRFGLFIPQGWRQDLTGIEPRDHWQTMSGLATHADQGDAFDSIWVYDHFHATPEPNGEATHEAWSLINAFAASTSRVRLGQMCTCMAYRNPAYLAKVATTADIISGGRVEMGIGAGWYEHEWRAYGYGFPGAGERLEALREGVEIMRELWSTGRSTYTGKHYSTDGALCFPLPLQGDTLPGNPHHGIPLWIAGGGEKKTLRIAAEYADYTNFDGALEGFKHKSEVLRGHCADVGRDFDQIVRSANYNVVIGETEQEVQDRLDWTRDHYLKAGLSEQVVDGQMAGLRSGPAVGTPEQIIENLSALQDQGMTYAIAYFTEAAYDTTGMHLFENHVIPALQ